MNRIKSRLFSPCFSLLLVWTAQTIAAPGDQPGAASATAPATTSSQISNPASAPLSKAGAAPSAAPKVAVTPSGIPTPAAIQPAAQTTLAIPTGDSNPDAQEVEPTAERPAIDAPATGLPASLPAPEPISPEVPVDSAVTTSEATPAQQASPFIPEDKASDVRVIIDISGSMKQNDPENLRIPALNLIVEMLPEGSQAGVWTFGQWVNMLITPDEVNQQWRDDAKEKAKKINSHGLRTNIGEAMEKATWKLSKDSGYAQSVILLTDGLVDITDDQDPQKQEKDEAERQRILSDILKLYKDSGTKIHTIALSENADKQLLDRLSLETGGMAEVVRNSEELVKAFVKTFDQAAPEVAEQVPLSKDNTFNIDNSVQEFTALIFRKAGTPAAQLKDPSGNVISQIKAIPNARWFGESVYDLVTVEQPEPGEWQILADLDPDNRVTVVSDLKMEIENLPTNLFPGQQIDFEVYLHEDGEIITRKEFLQLMTVEMKMTAQSGRSGTKVISDPAKIPEDGRYRESIKRLSKEGEYELQIRVDGKTFQRLRKTYLQVRQPIGFEIRKRMADGKLAYAVRVVPQSPEMQVSETRVIAKLKGPDDHSIIQSMPWVEEGVWETMVKPDKGPGTYKITMNIKGKLGENQEFRVKPEPLELTFPIPADFTHEYFVKDEMTEIEAPMDAQTEAPPAEPAMPDLAGKMEEQMQEQAAETEEAPADEVAEESDMAEEADAESAEGEEESTEGEEASEEEMEEGGLPIWLLVLIPVLTVFAGLGGFLGYRAVQKKKAAGASAPDKKAGSSLEDDIGSATEDVSLNDGLDDDDFDDDFDLSDDDEDEEISLSDDDDMDGLDLGDDDDDDLIAEEEPLGAEEPQDEAPAAEADDSIPDFDEDFDLGGDDEPPGDETPADEPPAAEEAPAEADVPSPEPVDDLEDILDSAIGEDEEPPSLSEEDEAPTMEADDGDAPASEDKDGDENIDEALANLENELDDIDIEGLMDDDGEEK